MGSDGALIAVDFRADRVNGWFLRMLATPFVSVDGRETRGSWRSPTGIRVEPGTYRVACFVRYRGTRARLGAQPRDVEVGAGSRVMVTARNGPLNHQPFALTVRREPPAGS
jgi:hypothetical protein